jgi:hypothetical protein
LKNIQDIIKEMENFSEQVATTVIDENTKLTSEEAEKELKSLLGDAPTVADPVLGTSCCVVNVPNGFTIPVTSDDDPTVPVTNQNIIFTTTNLACCVNPITVTCSAADCTTGTFQMPAFEVRLVGCIPFIANVFPITGPLLPINTTCEAVPGTTSICCINNFCVNKRIGVFATEAEAKALCNDPTLLTCANITAGLVATRLSLCAGNGQAVQFAVTFSSVLGNC